MAADSRTDAVVADKFTQLVTDALTRAATEAGGQFLYASKTEPGLFPTTAAGKIAAKKCLDEGFLRVVRTDSRGKTSREICTATERGLDFLLENSSPKQVLEDFVRILEARRGEVAELLTTTRRLADGLDGLTSAVSQVLPKIQTSRVSVPVGESVSSPSSNGTMPHRGGTEMPAVAVPAPAPAPTSAALAEAEDLAEALLARLGDWSSSAGAAQDCPLPDLFRSLTMRDAELTIGLFHDALRSLHNSGRIYLHPWTGPLYAIPEPSYAMLVGHGIAYYASQRS